MSTTYQLTDIRNVALAGHGASGKTSLADALMYLSKAVDRRGSVDDGTSISDVDDEEKRRKFTIDCHLFHVDWKGREIHLVDTPGYPDFIGNALSGLAAVENVVVAVSATSGVEVNTRRVFQEAKRLHLGCLIALTKMDADNADFAARLQQIRENFGSKCVPFYVPIGQGASFSGLYDVLGHSDTSDPGLAMDPGEAYRMVIETIVELDEGLLNRYLDGESIPADELREAVHREIAEGQIIPIVPVSVRKDIGVRELFDLIADCGLTPEDLHRFANPDDANGDGDGVEFSVSPDSPLIAQVFKSSNDQFMGKLNFLRVFSGKITPDTMLLNCRTGKTAKPGHLYRQQGKAQEEVKEAIAGDIVAIAKFDDLHISDTVACANNGNAHLILNAIKYPVPMVPRAVEPKTREDEPRISAGLAKIADEDPTFSIRRDTRTHEMVISGMSDLHLDVIQNRLKNRFKLEMNTHIPHVPYLETITGEAEANHRHKKQTGGRGQFAEVHLRVRPLERGKGFHFVDAVKGGTIPGQFIPAVEKGVREQLEKGVISGNQAVDVEVEVFFGKDHPVDSSEHAFKSASATAFRSAFEQAKPVLLEPIVAVEITIPNEKFGDISADLSIRRGHITGMEALPGNLQVIHADIPLAEVLTYASQLKSMTGGQGSFVMDFKSYDPVPPNVQQQIVEKYRKSRAGIEED